MLPYIAYMDPMGYKPLFSHYGDYQDMMAIFRKKKTVK